MLKSARQINLIDCFFICLLMKVNKKKTFFIIVFQKLSIIKKSVIISASVHIHNVQTKGTHFKSMGKSVHKGRWLHLIRQLIALQGHFRNIYDILRQLNRDIHIVIVLLWV